MDEYGYCEVERKTWNLDSDQRSGTLEWHGEYVEMFWQNNHLI